LKITLSAGGTFQGIKLMLTKIANIIVHDDIVKFVLQSLRVFGLQTNNFWLNALKSVKPLFSSMFQIHPNFAKWHWLKALYPLKICKMSVENVMIINDESKRYFVKPGT